MAQVKEIQVCGGKIYNNLYEACMEYVNLIAYKETDREKLNFTITLDNGETKSITFRQEEGRVDVYGDFDGMPNALEYAYEILGKKI